MTLQEKEKLLTQITVFINNLSVDDEVMTSSKSRAPNEPKAAEKIELLTIKECTQTISGLSECTVRQLIAQNKIPYIRTGAGKRGKILVSKTALLEYFGGGAA